MAPVEWVSDRAAVYKTDYEQHNFGGGELVTYQRETHDADLPGRPLLYKMLYSAVIMRGAMYGNRVSSQEPHLSSPDILHPDANP